jgi:hypothetical protein
LSDADVARFLIELVLIGSGYRSAPLAETDPLRLAAHRYARPAKPPVIKAKRKAKATTKSAKAKQIKNRKGGAA